MDKSEEIINAIMKMTGKSREEIEKEVEETQDEPINQRILDCYMNDGL